MKTEVIVMLNTVIYSKEDETLVRLPIGVDGRISKKEAEEYFISKEIPFKEIFKIEKKYYRTMVNVQDLIEIQ